MLEHDWLTTHDFRGMVSLLTPASADPPRGLRSLLRLTVGRLFGKPTPAQPVVSGTNRQSELLMAACWASIWHTFGVPTYPPITTLNEWVEFLERRADNVPQPDDDAILQYFTQATEEPIPGGQAVGIACLMGGPTNFWMMARFTPVIGFLAKYFPEDSMVGCDLVRDVYGNPFRKAEFNPAWRTSTAKGLAEAIYEEKAFDRMPILADALEDAGCDDADVLAHCRDGPNHVRGCWVVDRVLGKQ